MARQALWLQAIERRLAATSAALAAMKGVKMCGLTEGLLKNLHQLRIDEMRIARKFRVLLIWNLAFGEAGSTRYHVMMLTANSMARTRDCSRPDFCSLLDPGEAQRQSYYTRCLENLHFPFALCSPAAALGLAGHVACHFHGCRRELRPHPGLPRCRTSPGFAGGAAGYDAFPEVHELHKGNC